MDKALVEFQVSSNGDTAIFWQKLADEYAWSLSYSKNAFNEYKKFLYLIKVSGCRCVPSRIVDKVWHVHMTFTQSYWHELCQHVLGMEIHHTPSSKNQQSLQSDEQAYEFTKTLYLKHFGHYPSEIYWPKVNMKKSKKLWVGITSFFCITLLTACTSQSYDDFELAFKWIIGIYFVYKVLSWLGKGGSGQGKCSGGCGSSCGGGD